MDHRLAQRRLRQRALWISLSWAGGGLVLLLTSPLAAWTPALGWSPLFWLLLAPASVLLGWGATGPQRRVCSRSRWRPRSAGRA